MAAGALTLLVLGAGAWAALALSRDQALAAAWVIPATGTPSPRALHAPGSQQTALELRPGFGAAHANLGRLHALRQNLPKAREHLRRAVELDPADEDSKRALQQLK